MTVATKPDNTITLNSVVYAVAGPVRQQPSSDFQAGLRIGSPQYDSLEGAFVLTIEDPSGGLGILDADERKNEHERLRDSEGAETRFPKAYSLPGLVVSTTLTGVGMGAIPIGVMKQWKDVMLIAVGNKMFKLSSALAVTDITPAVTADLGATAYTSDMLVHDFNDGFFANAAAVLWGFSGTTGTYQYYVAAADDPVAGSWSRQASSPVEELNYMVSYDQKVLKIQGAIIKESNEGTGNTWGDLAVSPFDKGTFMEVPLYSFFIGTSRVPFGPDFMPYMILAGKGGYAGKLAPMDYWARQMKPLELNIGRIAGGFMMEDGIIVSNTYDLWKVVPSDPPSLIPLGLRKQQGLDPAFASAVVSGIGAIGGDLVCGMTNLKTGGAGYIWILQHNGAGWHVRAKQQIDSGIVLSMWTYERPASYYGWRSAQYLCWVTWDGTTAKLHYIQEPIGGGAPEQDPTYAYAAAGAHTTPWMYGGFEHLFGALLRFRVRGAYLTASETITVKYRLDGDDTSGWTTLGTFNNSTTQLSWGASGIGVKFKSIRFRFEYARGGTTTLTPRARAFILLYDKKPVTRRSYNFVIDVSRMKAEQANADTDPWTGFTAALDFKEVLDKLVTVKDTYTLVPFTYDNEGTRYVKVISLPSTEIEIHDSMRRGQIQVQVTEIVNDDV
jgi:hypothetical protein